MPIEKTDPTQVWCPHCGKWVTTTVDSFCPACRVVVEEGRPREEAVSFENLGLGLLIENAMSLRFLQLNKGILDADEAQGYLDLMNEIERRYPAPDRLSARQAEAVRQGGCGAPLGGSPEEPAGVCQLEKHHDGECWEPTGDDR